MSFKQTGATKKMIPLLRIQKNRKKPNMKGNLKKKRESFPKGPPQKNQSSLSNGGPNASLPAVVAVRFIQDARAPSCAAGCHAPTEEGERAVPHEEWWRNDLDGKRFDESDECRHIVTN